MRLILGSRFGRTVRLVATSDSSQLTLFEDRLTRVLPSEQTPAEVLQEDESKPLAGPLSFITSSEL